MKKDAPGEGQHCETESGREGTGNSIHTSILYPNSGTAGARVEPGYAPLSSTPLSLSHSRHAATTVWASCASGAIVSQATEE